MAAVGAAVAVDLTAEAAAEAAVVVAIADTRLGELSPSCSIAAHAGVELRTARMKADQRAGWPGPATNCFQSSASVSIDNASARDRGSMCAAESAWAASACV